MAETVFRGPGVVLGALMDNRIEAFDGPSIGYQGDIIADPRLGPVAKDGLAPGRVAGFYNAFYTVSVDAIPSNTNTTTVAAAQAPSTTAGVALALTTAVLGTAANVPVWTPGVPIIPVGTTSTVTVSAIDFGFATGTTASNSSTVVVTDNTQFYQGQWIVIGGAGSGSVTNSALITQVVSIATANATGITIAPVAATALNNAPIGQANLYSPFLPVTSALIPAATPNAAEPYRLAGLAKSFDPAQGVCRNLTVTAASIGSGTTAFLVTGYDVYNNLMTELITASGTTTVGGNKAFKYISKVAVQTGATSGTPANVSVGVGNLIGFNFRSDKWEYSDIFFSGGFAINNTGWTSATTVVPSTNTTGDVRGTQNLSTILVGTGVAGGGMNGVNRVTMFQNIPMISAFNATPAKNISLFGVAQSTT